MLLSYTLQKGWVRAKIIWVFIEALAENGSDGVVATAGADLKV